MRQSSRRSRRSRKSSRKTSRKTSRRRSRKTSRKTSRKRSRKSSPKSKNKKSMKCNKPIKSWRLGKKRVVKACSRGREKLIHFGATGYGHNYSTVARRSFRARHNCNNATDKLTARYWACKNLWTAGGDTRRCPSNRRCKKSRRSRRSRRTYR
jgi:hypothetical protein